MIRYDSLHKQHEMSLLFFMSKNPEKKFEYGELRNCMKQNSKIPSPDSPMMRISNLTRDEMIIETISENPKKYFYQITNRGLIYIQDYFQRTVETVLRRKAKYGEVTIEKIQKSIAFEVDNDILLNMVNNIVNTSEFYQTVRAGEGKISFAFTEKGRREENRSTRKTLRKVDRDFRKKEASRSFEVNEVGLGGQVVNTYTTSKKGMGWSIFIVVVAIAVIIVTFIILG